MWRWLVAAAVAAEAPFYFGPYVQPMKPEMATAASLTTAVNTLQSQITALRNVAPVDLSPYALKTAIPVVPASPDLTGYAKKSDIPAPVDLTPYALKTAVPVLPDMSVFALKSAIPTLPDMSVYALKASVPAAFTPAMAAAASPVQSVNGATGAVVVQTFLRQISGVTSPSTVDGTLTWTFPVAFSNPPICGVELTAGAGTAATSYTYDYPSPVVETTTQVKYVITAHPNVLALVSTPLKVFAPTGTTARISCSAPT